MRIGRGIAIGAAAFAMLPGTVRAQADQSWEWTGGSGSFCIWYLSEPAAAAAVAGSRVTLRRAGEMVDLLPVPLRNVTRDEPRFADWIPGVICVGRYREASVDGRRVAVAEGDRSLTYTVAALGASAPYGRSADWVMVELGADAGSLHRIASGNRLAVDKRVLAVRVGLEGEEEQWELRLDGTRLSWDGAGRGEGRVSTTRSMSFGYAGDRNSTWTVELRTEGGSEQDIFGALRVEGKGPVAEALKTSPIRAVGPMLSGGTASLRFRSAAD